MGGESTTMCNPCPPTSLLPIFPAAHSAMDKYCAGWHVPFQLVTVARRRLLPRWTIMELDAAFAGRRHLALGNVKCPCGIPNGICRTSHTATVRHAAGQRTTD